MMKEFQDDQNSVVYELVDTLKLHIRYKAEVDDSIKRILIGYIERVTLLSTKKGREIMKPLTTTRIPPKEVLRARKMKRTTM